MPRNGLVNLVNAVVSDVINRKASASRIVATKNAQGATFTITIESSQPFPDGMDLRPDDTIDVQIQFDQKVKA